MNNSTLGNERNEILNIAGSISNIVFICGIINNIIIISFLFPTIKSHSFNKMLISLAISDIFLIVTAFGILYDRNEVHNFYWDFFFLYATLSSIYNTIALSKELYSKTNREFRNSKINLLILSVWLITFVISLIYKTIYSFEEYCEVFDFCDVVSVFTLNIIYLILEIILTIILPVGTCIFINRANSYKNIKNNTRLITTLICIIIISMFFKILDETIHILFDYDLPIAMQLLAGYLPVYKSCINLYIYTILMPSILVPKFKRVFLTIINYMEAKCVKAKCVKLNV